MRISSSARKPKRVAATAAEEGAVAFVEVPCVLTPRGANHSNEALGRRTGV